MTARTYELVHRTAYTYDEPVTSSYGRAVLLPRELPEQHVHRRVLEVEPEPADTAEHVDYFGNTSSYFAVTAPHSELVVTARSLVTVDRPADRPVADLPRATWEDVARAVRPGGTAETADGAGGASDALVVLREALLPSHHAAFTDPVRAWSAPSFAPGRPLVEVLADLTRRVHEEMRYLPGSTTVTSTHDEVLAQRAGVCQDFAHLTIAALRLHGVPARYVSGYLETQPPPGQEKLLGADASHAWVAAWLPGAGWVEVDPTNDTVVDSRYVVLGWGRDYADVPPLRGVIFTEAAESRLSVSVDLTPVELTDAGGRTSPDAPR
ncbi:MAG: transglutaminase family protein [Actinomycetales bacterium]|nr:transglutaminase family protein [Actinomycetales bacterium]